MLWFCAWHVRLVQKIIQPISSAIALIYFVFSSVLKFGQPTATCQLSASEPFLRRSSAASCPARRTMCNYDKTYSIRGMNSLHFFPSAIIILLSTGYSIGMRSRTAPPGFQQSKSRFEGQSLALGISHRSMQGGERADLTHGMDKGTIWHWPWRSISGRLYFGAGQSTSEAPGHQDEMAREESGYLEGECRSG